MSPADFMNLNIKDGKYMLMTEKHHAYIVLEFYRELKKRKGDLGTEIFRCAARIYGEERGHRMALRVLRDGYPLNYDSYFAYSEWESTEGYFDVTMKAGSKTVEECVTKCPWAQVFSEEGCPECGIDYCSEIDRSIVRGFNPNLKLDMPKIQYKDGCCQFFFKDSSITENCFYLGEQMAEKSRGPILLPFSYHCGHVYAVFRKVLTDTLLEEGEESIQAVYNRLLQRLGEEFMNCLEEYQNQNFSSLP